MNFVKLIIIGIIILLITSCATFRTDLSDYDKLCFVQLGHPDGNLIYIPNGGILPFFEIYKMVNNNYEFMVKLKAPPLPMRNMGNNVSWLDEQSNNLTEQYKVYAVNETSDQKISMNLWLQLWNEEQQKYIFKEEIRFDD